MWTSSGGLLTWLLSAAALAFNVKTPDYPVNASLHHPTWIPVQLDHLPKGAEISWKFDSQNHCTTIVRFEADGERRKYFPANQFSGRVKLLDNFTLWIDSVKQEDVGTYIVTVTTSREWKAQVSLQAYEPVSKAMVEVANVSSGQSCNLTLRCSAASGDNLSFRWSPGDHTQIEQFSDRDIHLWLSVGLSDRINYTCTVWNPISWETASISREHACEHRTEASSLLVVLSPVIILLIVLVGVAAVVSYKFCTKCGSVTLPEWRQRDEGQAACTPNDYVNNAPGKIETIYSTVQHQCIS